MAAVLEAINTEHRRQCTDNVLNALLTKQEMEAERFAAHPIATLPAVCGCKDLT